MLVMIVCILLYMSANILSLAFGVPHRIYIGLDDERGFDGVAHNDISHCIYRIYHNYFFSRFFYLLLADCHDGFCFDLEHTLDM